ncbi:MAG: acyltransferase [Prevotella sp.]|nr:acyltransferase [Candidatus Equicola stercoris]
MNIDFNHSGTQQMPVREHGFDVIRSLAIILVVLQHSWTMLDLDLSVNSIQHHVYSSLIYGVALFIMLSGALNLRKPQPMMQFYRKRFTRILLPFLIFGTMTYILSALMGKYDDVNDVLSGVKMYLPFMLTGKINEAYWFIYLISALYLITPLMQRLFRGNGKVCRYVLIAAIVIWFLIECIMPVSSPFSIFLYCGYYMVGVFLMRYLFKMNHRFTLLVGSLCFVVFFLYNVYVHSLGQSSFVAECGEICSMFVVLSKVKFSTRILERISRYSYFMYLTHFIVIRLLYTFFPDAFPSSWITPIYTTVIVISLEYVLCRIMDGVGWVPKKIVGI